MGNRYIGTNDHDKYKMAESQPCGFTFRCRKKYFYDKDLKYIESIKSKIWREFQLCNDMWSRNAATMGKKPAWLSEARNQ